LDRFAGRVGGAERPYSQQLEAGPEVLERFRGTPTLLSGVLCPECHVLTLATTNRSRGPHVCGPSAPNIPPRGEGRKDRCVA